MTTITCDKCHKTTNVDRYYIPNFTVRRDPTPSERASRPYSYSGYGVEIFSKDLCKECQDKLVSSLQSFFGKFLNE